MVSVPFDICSAELTREASNAERRHLGLSSLPFCLSNTTQNVTYTPQAALDKSSSLEWFSRPLDTESKVIALSRTVDQQKKCPQYHNSVC